MEDESSNSDSEKEFNQQELEVALYSQIHFESDVDIKNQYHRVILPLKIGVKELPVRITPTAKKPVICGEFIAFSSSICESAASQPEINEATTVKELEVIESRKDDFMDGDFIKLDVVTPPRNDSMITPQRNDRMIISPRNDRMITPPRNDSVKSSTYRNNTTAYQACSPEYKPNTGNIDLMKSMLKSDVRIILHDIFSDVKEIQSDGNKSRSLTEEENSKSISKVKNTLKADRVLKPKEILLPFSHTKTSYKAEDIVSRKDIILISPESVKKRKSKSPKNNRTQLEGFLHLSKSETESSVMKSKKKAKLSKTAAAVKPRVPAVLLRRPPAVVVKYRQDSDTNTDYSDSETSTGPSPLKGRQSTLKDSSQNSNANLARKDVRTKSSKEKSMSQVPPGRQDMSDFKNVKIEQDCVTACSDDVINNIKKENEDNDTDEEEDEDRSDASSKMGGDTTDETEEEVEDVKSELLPEGQTEDSSDSGDTISSSEDTDSSDPEDFMAETIPGLEFNLDKGVNESTFTKPDVDNWKIDEKDRLNIPSTLSRYFFPRAIQCRNCKVDGHMSRDCPQPLKRRCIYCAVAGHSYQACPNAICFNCGTPGHKFTKCTERKTDWKTECKRCWMPGHEEEKCPDRWRQYHITVGTKGSHLITAPKDVKNSLIFCYNCGKKGHLGFECRLPRMNQFLVPNYPFIACYDTKNKRKEMQSRSDTKSSRKTGTDHGNRKRDKQHSSGRKSQVFEKDDQSQRSKDPRKKKKHGQEKKRWGSEETGDYYRQHERGEEHVGKRKRKRSNHKGKWENSTNVNTTYEGNNPSGSESKGTVLRKSHKSSYMDQQREFERGITDNDIMNDFESHQVNNNEWWGQPPKKRRKKNKEEFSSYTDEDWQRGEEKNIASQGGKMHRMRDKAQSKGGEWRKNKQQQSVQGKQGQKFSSSEMNRQHKVDHFYGTNINTTYKNVKGDNFSKHKQNHGQRSSVSTIFKQLPLHPSASWPIVQKASDFSHNKNGFQTRDQRFVAMNRHCDITISFRK